MGYILFMPLRKQLLVNDEVYHVFNRGVASLPIFKSVRDYSRFLNLIDYYRFPGMALSFSTYLNLNTNLKQEFIGKIKQSQTPVIEIYAYCLMPNHFHFLVRQLKDEGIKSIFSRVQNAYAKYINIKTKRAGPLFESRFKAKRLESEEHLLHVSRYIHLNPSTAFIIKPKNLGDYIWSSYPEYLGQKKSIFVNQDLVLRLSGSLEKYKEFVFDQADYQRRLAGIKHLVFE